MTEMIGDRLKKLRKNYNFTQNQIAEYLDFNQGQIAKIENNQRRLQTSSLEKLCELYNCSQEYILYGEEEYSKREVAFRTNVKNINLDTVAKMNKIIGNIELLSRIVNEYESDKDGIS